MNRLVLLLIISLSFISNSFSQWQSIDLSTTESFYDVFYLNDSTAWIAGNNIILKTTDSGENWTEQISPVADTRYYSIYFKDELNGWAVGKKATASTAGRIHYTNNGGETWSVYLTGGSLPWWSIAFEDENNGVIVGQEGQILYTNDAGLTWSNRTSPTGDAGIIRGVSLANDQTGIAVGYSSPSVGFIMKTTDKGNSWQVVSDDIVGGLNAVDFVNSNVGYSVGNGGAIYKTEDGGEVWSALNSGTTLTLNSVFFINEYEGIAVGFGGNILHTSDGGINWVTEYSGTTTALRSVDRNFCVGNSGNFLVYNKTIEVVNTKLKYNPDTETKDTLETIMRIEDLSIAADGSSATTFKYTGASLDNIILRIKENEEVENFDENGHFDSGNIPADNPNTKTFEYSHPKFLNLENDQSKTVNIEVYNTEIEAVLTEYPIKIVKPSVLMVHGIWSNGKTGFGDMRDELVASGMYNFNQLYLADYEGDKPATTTIDKFVRGKNNLLFFFDLFSNTSSGKVDVLAHSNGGLLSRYYILSDQYSNDINKLITFNTPHSGSQLANLLKDPSYSFLNTAVRKLYRNPNNGVIDDLKTDSELITLLRNNASNSNFNEVAVHTITSTLIEQPANTFEFLLEVYLKYEVTTSNFLLSAFLFDNDQHDVIVPLGSQNGGAINSTNFTEQWHIGSTENSSIQSHTKSLLNQNPNNDSYFSFAGFFPEVLNYTVGAGNRIANRSSDETLDIITPIEGETYNAGNEVTIEVSGSSGIENIVSSMGGSLTAVQTQVIENSSTDNFNFTIPSDAFGRLDIISVGFDANGYADYDSTYIYVSTDALLESINITEEIVFVPNGETSSITIIGHYSDGVSRNITSIEGITYEFENNYAENSAVGILTGLAVGEDNLTVTIGGISDSAVIVVTDSTDLYEITFNDLCIDESCDVCLGDFDDDRAITSGDLTLFLSNFGCLIDCYADLDDDAAVTSSDMTLFLSVFGLECD